MSEEVPLEVGADDVEMEEQQVAETGEDGDEVPEHADIEPELEPRKTFLDYIKTPIVNLVVGSGSDATTLSAHEGMLTTSPFFAEKASSFKPNAKRKIDLPDEDLEAVGSVIEFLYNGDYFPKRLNPNEKASGLETDPTIPADDTEGVALLRHARIYTLAERFGLPQLKSLAHTKIHRTGSTAKGEIQYARYVYQHSSPEDQTIRRPVASFWATRSHVLRHEAEQEFRQLCLEFPQFGFDVLSLVLDQREKRAPQGAPLIEVATSSQATPASGRKRARRD